MKLQSLVDLNDYKQYVRKETIDRVQHKAKQLQGMHAVHVNSTYYGGGVAELLGSLVVLMNQCGIETGWRVIQGSPDFFSITKKMHNALQSGDINLSDRKKQIYENVIHENAIRNHLDHDAIVVHDPQPLPMIKHYRKRGPWVWHCHIDMTDPYSELLNYLDQFIEDYDAVISTLEEYKQDFSVPQRHIMPAIDPFTIKNKHLSNDVIRERMDYYDIPIDLPIVTQISRFDRWKDPHGVIDSFKKAQKEIDATLVLLGNVATDDPEGEKVYKSLLDRREERVIILSRQDTALVNALQSHATVVLQKSIREGFGLTVTEALWKGTPVIGGNVGGIRHQIEDGINGYLVDDTEEAAERIVELITHPDKADEMGERGREKVRNNFLMIRLLEDYLDLLSGFTPQFELTNA